MHRNELLTLLNNYRTPFMEEASMVDRTRRFVMQHVNCFDRTLMEGHVSGSAWILNPSRSAALLMHHRKLDLWLQLGGHADGDPDILRVILNETAEESGLAVENIKLLSEHIFDVDVHTVHENEYDPRHIHYDIRFLVEIDDRIPVPGNDESHDIGWIPLQQISRFNNALSLHRMVRKTNQLAKGNYNYFKF